MPIEKEIATITVLPGDGKEDSKRLQIALKAVEGSAHPLMCDSCGQDFSLESDERKPFLCRPCVLCYDYWTNLEKPPRSHRARTRAIEVRARSPWQTRSLCGKCLGEAGFPVVTKFASHPVFEGGPDDLSSLDLSVSESEDEDGR